MNKFDYAKGYTWAEVMESIQNLYDTIKIGANVGIGPNVCIYDHDHDFRAEGGKKSKKYACFFYFL